MNQQDQQEILSICKEMEIKEWEFVEVKKGIKAGLTKEQIMLYVKKEYKAVEMEQIRIGMEDGIDYTKYLNEATAEDMKTKRLALYHDNDVHGEQIKMEQLEQRMEQLIGTLSEKMDLLINDQAVMKNDIEQVNEAYRIQSENLDRRICEAVNQLSTKLQEQKIVYQPETEKQEEKQENKSWFASIQKTFKLGKKKEFEDIITKSNLNAAQIEQITLGIEHGLSYDQIYGYAKNTIAAEQMAQMRIAFEAQNRRTKQEKGVLEQPEQKKERQTEGQPEQEVLDIESVGELEDLPMLDVEPDEEENQVFEDELELDDVEEEEYE